VPANGVVGQGYLRPKTLFASFPAIADAARAKPLGKCFVLQRKFRAIHSGPIFVGGVKQFSVAIDRFEAHMRNKFSDFVLFFSILCRRFNNRAWYSYEVALIINFSLKVQSILSL
jgi:hypothetical protein